MEKVGQLGARLPTRVKKPVFEATIAAGKLLNYYLRQKHRARRWQSLVNEFFDQERALLIILDSARYDLFERHYGDYLDGTLHRAVSPGSATPAVMEATFTEYYDVTYFSTIPFINSGGIESDRHLVPYDLFEFSAKTHFDRIIDLWDIAWDPELNTTPPWRVNELVIEETNSFDNGIVHYCQPHGPWIGDPQISIVKDKTITERIKTGEFSEDTLRKAYQSNLRLGLEHAAELIEELDFDGKVVITSDHGELLGEYGFYGSHPIFLPVPELRVVPWFEVESV